MPSFRSKAGDFLRRFRAAYERHGLFFVPRKPNLDLLAAEGITVEEVESAVLGLTPGNYSRPGPGGEGEEDPWTFRADLDRASLELRLALARPGAVGTHLTGSPKHELATVSLRRHVDERNHKVPVRSVRRRY